MAKTDSPERNNTGAGHEAREAEADSSAEANGSGQARGIGRRSFLAASVATGVVGWAGPSWAEQPCGVALATDSGPFYPKGKIPELTDLVSLSGHRKRARGQVLHLAGTVRDRQCRPLAGASLVLWQADDQGLYKHPEGGDQNALDPNFGYFTKVTTGADGTYRVRTIVPKSYKFAGLIRAAHIHMSLTHRGHGRLITEMYFAGTSHEDVRGKDRVFKSRDSKARHHLIAAPTAVRGELAKSDPGALTCRFDLQLRKG